MKYWLANVCRRGKQNGIKTSLNNLSLEDSQQIHLKALFETSQAFTDKGVLSSYLQQPSERYEEKEKGGASKQAKTVVNEVGISSLYSSQGEESKIA